MSSKEQKNGNAELKYILDKKDVKVEVKNIGEDNYLKSAYTYIK